MNLEAHEAVGTLTGAGVGLLWVINTAKRSPKIDLAWLGFFAALGCLGAILRYYYIKRYYIKQKD